MPLVTRQRPIMRPAIVSGGGGGSALFTDDFSAGLTHTENGISWGTSDRTSVINDGTYNVLNFPWPAGTIQTEQRFSFGATQRKELWFKYDIFVSSTYNHQSGNNKGHIMLWSNSTNSINNGGSGVDGYGAPNEMLFSIELDPHGNADGGSYGAPRYQSLDSGGLPIVDVNAQNESICPNLIVVGDKGTWRTIIIRVKSSSFQGTITPTTGVWADVGDGAIQIWKDGTKILDRTTLNLWHSSGWAGFNRGYLFGARNGTNPVTDYINIKSFVIATSNIWGVS